MTDAFSDFPGQGLSFVVSGPGVSVDPATGAVSVPGEALLAGIEVALGASRFRLSLLPPSPVLAPPAVEVAPVLSGSGVIGAPVEVDPGTWTGEPELALQWRLDGAAIGAAIPGATGAAFVPTPAEDGRDLDCRVTATTAAGTAGAAAGPLRVVEVAPAVTGAVADVVLVEGAIPGRVEAGACFSGRSLGFAVAGAGAEIGAEIDAQGVVLLPTGRVLAEEPVVVTATNSGGAASLVFRVSVTAAPVLPAAPVAQGVLPDLVLEQGSGERTVSAQAAFAGEDLVFALVEAPAGVTIESGSGLVRIATGAPVAAARITVRAKNAAGAAEQGFALTVRAVTASVFGSVEALADFRPVYYAAPSWTLEPEGFGRLAPATKGRTHGDWTRAQGDGRYRALARWNGPKTTLSNTRPFSFNGRLSKGGSGWIGFRVDVLQPSAGVRALEISEYVSGTTDATVLATAPVGWEWDRWHWVEVEVDGATVRARLYPEADAAPGWQVAGATTITASGAFGPGGFPLPTGGLYIDIRRLEYAPLIRGPEGVPPAAADADWSLGQFTELK